jgi:L-ectoine synthase
MKTRSIKEIENTERDVLFKEGRSLRLILEKDNMGFSVHKTIIPKGNKGHWHYKHHLEACYCISGSGILTNLDTKEVFNISVDTIYLLDNNDNHTFEALEDVVLISIFNPPVTGNEIHLPDGSYKKPISISKQIVDLVNNSENNYDAMEKVSDLLILKK